MRSLASWSLVCALVLLLRARVHECKTYRIVTAQDPPFIIYDQNSGNLTGFSIDLWDTIATTADPPIDYEWVYLNGSSASQLITYILSHNDSIDAAISDISITSARQELVDFSASMFSSGLSVLVPYTTPSTLNPSAVVIENMFSTLFWQELGILLLGVFLAAQVYFFLERKKKGDDATIRRNYMRGGLEDSIWWSGQILLSQGADIMPATLGGRILNLVAFLFALVLMSIIGGTITASLTVSSLTPPSGIQSYKDLGGHQVAVIANSTADKFMLSLGGSHIVYYSDSQKMLNDFVQPNPRMDAIVYDFPILLYFSQSQNGSGKCRLVGDVFSPQDYGLAFPQRSPLITSVNVALLQLQESGQYDSIYSNWFQPASSESQAPENALVADPMLLGITYGVAGFLFLATAAIFIYNTRRRSKRHASKQTEMRDLGSSSSNMLPPEAPPLSSHDKLVRLVNDVRKIQEAMSTIERQLVEKLETV